MTAEIKELLQSFKEWINFVQSLQGISEEIWNSSMEPGKWTIKDIVCHIMLWDNYFYDEAIHKIAAGEAITLKHINFDEFNGKAMEYAKKITTEDLIEKTIAYREKLVADIESLSEEAINQNYIDGDGNVFHVPQYLKDFIWHDQHHMTPMAKYLNQ